MAVHAKHTEDSVLIQKTKTILDKLTPQVVASEFPRILERIQAKRELTQVLGEMDPNLFVELRSDKDMAELKDGSRDYLQDETELRASFCMDVVDGRVVSATTAPFLVVNLRVDLRRDLEGITRSVADYYLDDISRDELLEALVAYIKSSAEDQLRKISTMSFESRELGWDGIAPAALNDQDLAKLIAADPFLLEKNSIAEWDQLRPGWIKALELYLIKHLPFNRGYDQNTYHSILMIRRVVQEVSDRLSPEALDAYHRTLFWHSVRRDIILFKEVPEHIREEESNDACAAVYRRDGDIVAELRQVNEHRWTKGQPKAYEAGIDSNTPDSYELATKGATKEFSRLRINPERLDQLQKHDRLHFVVSSWNTPDLLSGITKVASSELQDYLAALQHNIMPDGSMSPINWFKILAHTDYTASVTIHVPIDVDAHMGDEMQLAVEAAVKSNLAYVKDNWDRLQIATGLNLDFNKDRIEDFGNRVAVKVTPMPVDGVSVVTLATEPLVKDVR